MNRADLLNELKHFAPADASEKDSVAATIAFIQAEPDAFHRHLKKGHVCGSALLVGYGGDKVLLMFHKGLGRWLHFGGHADGEENIANVAMRETIEESGIENVTLLSDGIVDVDVHIIPDRPSKNEAEHPHYDIRYVFQTDETDFALTDGGVSDLQWVGWDEALARCGDPAMTRFLQKAKALCGR